MTANQQKTAASIVQYFQNQGFSKEQACGIAGNMFVESHFNTSALNPNDIGKQSIGLCQWRGDRNTNLRNFAQKSGTDWQHLPTQLSFTSYELSHSEKATIPKLKATNSPQDAALVWAKSFERCSSKSYSERQKVASEIYNGLTNQNWTADEEAVYGSSEESEDAEAEDLITAAAPSYSQESNKPSVNTSDFQNVTGYGIDWENDDSMIVFQSDPDEGGGGDSNYKAMNKTSQGCKPPTLSQKFSPSISVSEHSAPSVDSDNSEQHSIDTGSSSSNGDSNEVFAV